MRLLSAATVCLFFVSCRDIQPYEPPADVQGYRLDGIVTSSNGIPLGNVKINLYYYYDYYSTTPIDTQKVIVRPTTKVVDVAILNAAYVFVRQLYLGYHAPGPLLPILWDGLDAQGAPVPSGKYLMRFVLDNLLVKYTTIIIDGNVTSVTDSMGRFSIRGENLPIGAIFDSYFSNNTYDATYIVLPEVDLLITQSNKQKLYSAIQLNNNLITTIAMTLE